MSVIYSPIASLLEHAKEIPQEQEVENEKKRKLEDTAQDTESKRRRIEPTSNQTPGAPGARKSYKDRTNPRRTKSNQIFEYGNYQDYYGNKGYEGTDPRLAVLDPTWFIGATCLDVGCNAGLFTLDLAVMFDIDSIVGIDIDHRLIYKSRGNLNKYCNLAEKDHQHTSDSKIDPPNNKHVVFSDEEEKGDKDLDDNDDDDDAPEEIPFSKASTLIARGEDPDALLAAIEKEETEKTNDVTGSVAEPVTEAEQKPKNLSEFVSFYQEDYSRTSPRPNTYDVITCMSVIKWIHLNNGDDGVRKVFRKFARELRYGGYLVLEPQPWSSYKPKKLSEKGKLMYKQLQLRPDKFPELLQQEGLELIATKKPEVSIGGFSCREIQVYQKKAPRVNFAKESSADSKIVVVEKTNSDKVDKANNKQIEEANVNKIDEEANTDKCENETNSNNKMDEETNNNNNNNNKMGENNNVDEETNNKMDEETHNDQVDKETDSKMGPDSDPINSSNI